MNMVLFLCLAVSTQVGGSAYDKAYQQAEQEHKPLLVIVGADWCTGCVHLKNQILPKLAKPVQDLVVIALVDLDTEPNLAAQVMKGHSLPQLSLYTKGPQGWKRLHLAGTPTLEQLNEFIKTGVVQHMAKKAGTPE